MNDIDLKILYNLYFIEPSINELNKLLDIAPINTYKHLKKLKFLGLIKVLDSGSGRKSKVIKNFKDDFTLIEFLEILNIAERRLKLNG